MAPRGDCQQVGLRFGQGARRPAARHVPRRCAHGALAADGARAAAELGRSERVLLGPTRPPPPRCAREPLQRAACAHCFFTRPGLSYVNSSVLNSATVSLLLDFARARRPACRARPPASRLRGAPRVWPWRAAALRLRLPARSAPASLLPPSRRTLARPERSGFL